MQDKGPRTGERSDTIMVIRLDPVTKRSAILSFPRDLYVKIPGHGTSRINSAYRLNDPQLLIDTIRDEFGVSIDHFIQIDFCAFQKLVTAVGGVTVPLPYAVKDDEIGLDVFDPGCHTFNADEALKYVRSRHFQYRDANGKYHEDPSSDLGRIARQQDFLRRTLTAALNNNLLRPKTIAALYASYRDDVIVDRDLTIDKMIQFVGVVKGVDAADIQTYQIEATGKNVGGNDVLIWHKNSENMQAILDIFRGSAPLANAPEQVFEDATTTSTLPHATTSGGPVAVGPRDDGNAAGHRRHGATVQRAGLGDRAGPQRDLLISVRARRPVPRQPAMARRPSRSVRRTAARMLPPQRNPPRARRRPTPEHRPRRRSHRRRPSVGNRSAGSRSCEPLSPGSAADSQHAAHQRDRSCRDRATTRDR